jgi:hypothetical protein
MEGVEPANLFNFDETNFSDDTNVKKCICKKGAEYCKRLINTSKQAELKKTIANLNRTSYMVVLVLVKN